MEDIFFEYVLFLCLLHACCSIFYLELMGMKWKKVYHVVSSATEDQEEINRNQREIKRTLKGNQKEVKRKSNRIKRKSKGQ